MSQSQNGTDPDIVQENIEQSRHFPAYQDPGNLGCQRKSDLDVQQ